ncbi:hypothetical protein FO519_000852 [Halicephalobus sp. NKZ332]|nr:hypothetical protein FO519_000852 [Halicephalobus sp. NKZ332]
MKIQSGTLNVLQLATGFLLSYFSLGSHSFIVQTIIDQKHKEGVVDEHAGYVSAAIMYMVFTFANFIAAPVVGSLGARWAMVTSSVIISVFLAGFLFLNEPFLYISSALLGIGSAIIWTAQGKYIAMNSTDETASMHSSLFWGVSQVCVTGGGLFLYFEFKDLGADDKISDSKITVLYIILTVIAIVGIVIFALLRMPKRDESLVDPEVKPEPEKTFSELICSTFNLLLTKRMFFLAIAFTYTGVELSFTSAVYPTAISFTRKLATNTRTIIAFDAIAVGLGHATGGFLFGTLGGITKRLGRITIVLIGTIIHFFVFVAVYFNFPNDSPLKETDSQGTIKPPNVAISIICGYFLAFGDACWNTQIFSLLVSRYNKKSAEAFSLFKFFQSLATAIAFWYATHLKLLGHLIILFITGILGCAAFAIGNKLPTTSREAGDVASNRIH